MTESPLSASVDSRSPVPSRITLPAAGSGTPFWNAISSRSINTQLEERGILVRESNGAILDAAIVESSRRPRKVIEVMAEDRKEDTEELSSPVIRYFDDPDATWVKKGKKPYDGYKAHIAVDTRDGFIPGGHITPAHVADITEFDKLLTESNLAPDSPSLPTKATAAGRTVQSLTRNSISTGSCTRRHGGNP